MNLLILSGTASAINYIQSLTGDPGLRLFVSDCDPYCPGLYLPGVTPVLLPPARQTAEYRDALGQALARHDIDALIPTSDYDMEAVANWLHEGWSPPVKLISPPFMAFRTLADKVELAACLARKFPGHIPATFGLDADPKGLPYPVVVKPKNMSGGKGVTVCPDQEGLASALDNLRGRYGSQGLIQQFIPGSNYVLTMIYDKQGQPRVSVGMRSNLTFFSWGGGGCGGELVDLPELAALAQAMVAEAGGWRGPINLEFRRHEATGRFYLLEANCRLNGYSYLTTLNGINLPRLVLAVLQDQEVAPAILPPAGERNMFVIGYREIPVAEFLS